MTTEIAVNGPTEDPRGWWEWRGKVGEQLRRTERLEADFKACPLREDGKINEVHARISKLDRRVTALERRVAWIAGAAAAGGAIGGAVLGGVLQHVLAG